MLGDILDPVHLVILLVIVLLIFGPKRLPELGSSLGKTIRMFKDAQQSPNRLGENSTITETKPSDASQSSQE